MYFVGTGAVEAVSAHDGTVLRTLGPGDFFGEIALLYDEARSATVRAVDHCHIYRLDRELLEQVIHNYPRVEAEIRSIADARRAET
jgi:CRP-like cAMP-binding protein